MTAVARDQRHTKANRCPICGGADGDPRGKERRCAGFTSSDGTYVHCSREELAGSIEQNNAQLFAHKMNGTCRCGTSHGPDLRASYVDTKKTLVCTYDYTDERGAVLFHVDRFRLASGDKTFRQRQPSGVHDTVGVQRVPYRLPELRDAVKAGKTVYICEGEKDVESMLHAGFAATCNPMGAGKWKHVAETAEKVLAGADVVIIADADKEGRMHARQVSASLQGVARSVTVLEPVKPYKDATALLEAGRTLADLVPLQLDEISSETEADEQASSTPLVTIGVAELFAPLPPIEWTVEGLGLTPGAASALAGFGFVGKTVVAQTLALAIASGTRLWDLFTVSQGRVLHVDFEQGRRLTSERYQRLARGAGLTPDHLGDNLRAAIMPPIYLDSAQAADVYARAFDGCRFAVVDSLRAAAPSADENSSDVRRHIDVLTRASELTGCMALFLHHARKPSDNDKGGAKTSIRGSSAIFDACASVFVLEAEKGKPTRVHHEKDRARGILMPDFGLRIEDVPDGDDPRAGLRVVHLEGEQLAPVEGGADVAKHVGAIAKIRAHLAANPNTPGADALRARIGGQRAVVVAALREMEATGEVTNAGTKQHPKLRLTSGGAT